MYGVRLIPALKGLDSRNGCPFYLLKGVGDQEVGMARKSQKSFTQRNSNLIVFVVVLVVIGVILFMMNSAPTHTPHVVKETPTPSTTSTSQPSEVSTGPTLQDEINNYQQNVLPNQLKNDVNNIGQYATQYSAPTQSGATQQ